MHWSVSEKKNRPTGRLKLNAPVICAIKIHATWVLLRSAHLLANLYRQLLKLAAQREHRSVASMVEVLVLAYAQEHGLEAENEALHKAGERKKKHGTD